MLIVITAPSGAGKTTIAREMLKMYPEMLFSVSATTRTKRENEFDGKDYYFISEEDFLSRILKNEFTEYEEVHGNKYGTLVSEIMKGLETGKDMIFDVDVKGAMSIKKNFPEAVVIFIYSDKDELIERLRKRKTESDSEIQKRIERMEYELNLKNSFDYSVENRSEPGGLQKAVKEIFKIIESKKIYNKT